MTVIGPTSRIRPLFVLFLTLAAGMFALGACTGSGEPSETPTVPAGTSATATPGDGPEPTPADEFPSGAAEEQYSVRPDEGVPQLGGELRLGRDQSIDTLTFIDNVPALMKDYATHIHDTVVRLDWREGDYGFSGAIESALAESWDLNNDGTVYTFQIREGVTFHDGSPLTAEDVAASLNFYRDPGDITPPGSSYVRGIIDSAEATGPMEVTVTLPAPNPTFLDNMAVTWVGIMAKADLDQGAEWYRTNSNGTGPFMFDHDSWERGSTHRYAANPGYWDEGLPYLDGVTVFGIATVAGRVAAFETRNIDMVSGLTPEQGGEMAGRLPGTIHRQEPNMSHQYVLLNATRPPFDDERVRQAVHLWIDRQQIIDTALSGAGFVGGWINPPIHAGFGTPAEELMESNLAYMPDKTEARARAQELLDEAGIPEGMPITVLSRYTAGTSLNANIVLGEQLREMGFDVTVETLESTAGVVALQNLEYDAAYYGGASPLKVPDGTLNRYLATSGQRNYTGNEDPYFMGLVEEMNMTVDVDRRAEIIDEISEYLLEGTYPMVIVLWGQENIVKWDWLAGERMIANSGEPVHLRAWLSEDAPGR